MTSKPGTAETGELWLGLSGMSDEELRAQYTAMQRRAAMLQSEIERRRSTTALEVLNLASKPSQRLL
jgi:hypothetical protein